MPFKFEVGVPHSRVIFGDIFKNKKNKKKPLDLCNNYIEITANITVHNTLSINH